MTILEKKSNRKKKSIINLVKSGEYSISYALMLVEELNDTGKLTETDYNELAEYLENLLNEETEQENEENETEETFEIIEEPIENLENTEEED